MPAAKVILGIAGSIAACKAPDIVRLLVAADYEVQPVLTESGRAFVTDTTLSALCGRRVRDDLWDAEAEMSMGHIELARWADLLLIAPASASLIARLAHGHSFDLLSCLYLASSAPVLLAPAMNQGMWGHVTTQRNVETLRADGVQILGPEVGDQACGDFGPGRMTEPEEIVDHTIRYLSENTTYLKGVRVLVTAGPTREAIDLVRFISNSSSGRQGFAIAQAAAVAGADVTLISGPVSLPTPANTHRIDVTSAAEMKKAVIEKASKADIFFSVAAVADYRPTFTVDRKLKRCDFSSSSPPTFQLEETEDIVATVAATNPHLFLVGFAAETHDVLKHARDKRSRKRLNAIVANDVSDDSIGFFSSQNEVTLLHDGGEEFFVRAPKLAIARGIVKRIAELYRSNS